VRRGGSCIYDQDFAAASVRSYDDPNYGVYDFGFRLVVSAPIESLFSDFSEL
jgi:hypothetical protein